MTPTTPRDALETIDVIYVRSERRLTGSECERILTALAPWLMEWRPIEEYKPEMGLVMFGLWVTSTSPIQTTWETYILALSEDGSLVDNNGDDSSGWSFSDLEAFMPLPQPPKVTK